MNPKLHIKINHLVRMKEIKDNEGNIKYSIESRRRRKDEWVLSLKTSSLKKAIMNKHFYWLIAISELGYNRDLFYRRKKRIKKK